ARSPLAIALALVLPLGLAACDGPANAATAGQPAATAPADTATPAERAAETARLNAWFEAKYEEQLKFSPIRLTFLGRKELYDQIDDVSDAAMQRQLDWLEASVKEMEAQFDYDRLEPEAQLSWNLWKKEYESARDGMPFLLDGYPFDQMNGMHTMAPTFLINFHKVEDESDYLAYVSRLRKLPGAFDILIGRVRQAAAQGIRPPAFAWEGVADQSRKIIT